MTPSGCRGLWPGLLPALLLAGLGGCAKKCETGPTGQEYCTYEDICMEDPPECKPKFMPGSMDLRFSKPLPARVEVYLGKNLETAKKVQALVPVSETAVAILSEGDYVITALYVRGGDSTLVVAAAEMTQDELLLCSDKTCHEYEQVEADLRLR